eukprot:scaffold74676_cov58-Phaeocystis_antarctica.AAC.3
MLPASREAAVPHMAGPSTPSAMPLSLSAPYVPKRMVSYVTAPPMVACTPRKSASGPAVRTMSSATRLTDVPPPTVPASRPRTAASQRVGAELAGEDVLRREEDALGEHGADNGEPVAPPEPDHALAFHHRAEARRR